MDKFYKDKQQIINWLDKHEVKNYTLIQMKNTDLQQMQMVMLIYFVNI